MAQCQLKFASQPLSFDTDAKRVAFAGSFLRSQAFDWFAPHVDPDTGVISFDTWAAFSQSLAAAFDDPDRIATAERELKKLEQGKKTASAYHAEFVSVVAVLGLDARAKISAFRNGLSKEVRQLLASQVAPPTDFDQFVNLIIKLDNNLRVLRQDSEASSAPRNPSPGSGSSKPPAPPRQQSTATGVHPGPMDTSNSTRRSGPRARLTEEQKQYRRDNNLCVYCGGAGHYASSCPKKVARTGNSVTTSGRVALDAPAPAAPAAPTPQLASGAGLYSVAAQPPKNTNR
jgi:hypothetical protein